MKHLVTIQIFEGKGCELVKEEFVKYIKKSGNIKILKFDRMEIVVPDYLEDKFIEALST